MTTTTNTALGTPIQGVTLYSFTRLFHARQLGFDDLVREAARRGLGPGLEIVGFQAIKGFPQVGDDFVSRFRGLIDETGLVPTALGANADAGIRRDRMLTNDELVAYMEPQIQVAARLGFPVVRLQFSLTPDDMERLLPIAERYDVKLGMEIHAHHTVGHPTMQALLERFERLGSPLLGFIPDWGATMVALPPSLLKSYRAQGVAEPVIEKIQELSAELQRRGAPRTDEEQDGRIGEVIQAISGLGEGRLAVEIAVNICGLFGRGSIDEWADIMPWIVHTHGKFYEIDESGEEPSVPIPGIIDLYVKHGYSRSISSEWEGFHWNDWENAFDVIAGQQALLRRSAEQAGSRLVTDRAEAANLIAAAKR